MSTSESLPNRPDDVLRSQVERVISANYDLEREIGRGGMGIVYRARDKRLKRVVAVKLLPPDLAYRADIRSRFLREAETAAQLNHPNIVPIYTVEEADNLVFFIMGYVGGDNLARQLRTSGPLPPEQVRRILREVADALAYAHRHGVIHRDIKPDNIMLDPGTGRAMVTDFGIARAVHDGTDTRLTTTGAAIGTPAYMSPEQCAGDRELDGRSDLYSLGVVGYQLIAGELPFVANNTPSMLVKHLSETPKPLHERASVPRELSDTIMRCLAKDPADRFETATDLMDALDGAHVAPPARRTEVTGRVVQSPQGSASNMPSPGDVMRWEAEPVRKFRKKLVSYLAINLAVIPLTIFGLIGNGALFFFTAFWGILIAAGYAKLWNAGYDWRDVFRRTRDTLFVDVVGETIDNTRAMFDPQKRGAARERMRERLRQQSGLMALPSPIPSDPGRGRVPVVTGIQQPIAIGDAANLPTVQEASVARAEIHRVMHALPEADRTMLPDVAASADQLYARIEVLASRVDELTRADVPGMGEAIEREIAQLESEANPLDEERSERRVRRLAQLRRQRVSLRDLRTRRETAEQKLDRCLTAMRSMRLDLLRLSTGSRSYESVTILAEQARQLGGEVDAVLYAQDEIARVLDKGRPPTKTP